LPWLNAVARIRGLATSGKGGDVNPGLRRLALGYMLAPAYAG